MKIYKCTICGFEYGEKKEDVSFDDLPDGWVCPDCGAVKDLFDEKPAEKPNLGGNALFKASYGLYVLSAEDGEKDNACIINTFLQITSTEPIICVITVNKQNLTHDMILGTKRFNLSTLTTEAPFEVIKRFGFQSGREGCVNKFEGFTDCSRSENGLIYLNRYANAYMSFDVAETEDFGTHTMFKAVLTGSGVLNDDDSLTYGYYQRKIKPKNETAESTGYRCNICGYVHKSADLPDDFICPICKHGIIDFVKI